MKLNDYQLAAQVERRSFLYDNKEPLHKNKAAIADAWKTIGSICRCPPKECEHRFNILRQRFSKERTKHENGIGPPWPLYDAMQFLHNFIKKRRRYCANDFEQRDESNDNYDDANSSYIYEENNVVTSVATAPIHTITFQEPEKLFRFDNESPRNDTTTNMEDNRDFGQPSQDPIAFKETPTNSSSLNSDDDSIKAYCMSLYDDLKAMDRRSLRLCKVEILQTINKYLD